MSIILTKTDYILWRECQKNVWLKINRPEIYGVAELSEFEKQIIETGNDVELEARKLFPKGFLVQGRDAEAQETTKNLIADKCEIIFQPIFVKDGFLAAVDILELNSDGTYNIYEVKSTTDVDKKTHYHDLAFQINLLEKFALPRQSSNNVGSSHAIAYSEGGIKIKKASVIHLNSDYVRQGQINIHQLFHIEDVTEIVREMVWTVGQEMDFALKYLQQIQEPSGHCDCVYKGRSNHCSTFAYSNPKVPVYGVHDISRIGASKAKLQDLIDVGIFELADVPEDAFNKLSSPQKNQIIAHVQDKILQDKLSIAKELGELIFPLYFLDYETFPCAIPRFDGFSPYQQIPFQYSLYILDGPKTTPRHFEFLYSEKLDPSLDFVKSLQKDVGDNGTIIVWNKKFECKINDELAERLPDFKLFIEKTNARVYDLMDIFGKQFYVHKDFKGKISIKNILPVLVPELSYQDLEIKEGGSASQKWNEMNQEHISPEEKEAIIKNLKIYCGLDTYAMFAIWQYLTYLVN